MDIDTVFMLFKPTMGRCDKIYGSYVCIFRRFEQANNFVHMFKELVPSAKVFVRGLYVKITPGHDQETNAVLEKYFSAR